MQAELPIKTCLMQGGTGETFLGTRRKDLARMLLSIAKQSDVA